MEISLLATLYVCYVRGDLKNWKINVQFYVVQIHSKSSDENIYIKKKKKTYEYTNIPLAN